MKKIAAGILISAMTAAMLSGCAGGSSSSSTSSSSAATEAAAAEETTAAVEAGTESAEQTAAADTTEAAEAASDLAYPATTVDGDAISYADYQAADTDSLVIVDTFVQAKQGWWEDSSKGGIGTATLYTQNEDGGFFIYNMNLPQEDYDKLIEGQEIKISGYKSEWEGEVEITDVDAYEIEDGNWVAEAKDVTDLLGTDDLEQYQNQKVSFAGLTVAASDDGSGTEVPYLYNWDGSGSEGDDLYFNVTKADDPDTVYTFTVESYLCGSDTDVYKAVEALNVGDVIDVEGFLYWYEGAQPHVTNVTVE